MPDWALVLVYWLHMTAAVVWLGSVAGLTLLVSPVVVKRLKATDQIELLEGVQSRLDSISWFCLFLIVATGLFQMSVNRNYHGLVQIENLWEAAILTKIALLIVVAIISGAMSWGITPAIQRARSRARRTGEMTNMESLRRREMRLLAAQLILTGLILLATALARTMSQ
jgi:uncharacterized membrane protein